MHWCARMWTAATDCERPRPLINLGRISFLCPVADTIQRG
jgi:hypothetical protein